MAATTQTIQDRTVPHVRGALEKGPLAKILSVINCCLQKIIHVIPGRVGLSSHAGGDFGASPCNLNTAPKNDAPSQ